MRRLYYINPNIQRSFTILFTFISAIEILFFGFTFFLIERFQILHFGSVTVYIKVAIILSLLLIFSAFNFWYGTRLSHRIVGPLVQIQRVIESALRDNYKQRVHLRSKDLLHDIGDQLNLLLEKLENSQEHDLQHDFTQKETKDE